MAADEDPDYDQFDRLLDTDPLELARLARRYLGGMTGRQVIVTGSRHTNVEGSRLVQSTLHFEHERLPIGLLIEGGASGVDLAARQWSEYMNVPWVTVWATWGVGRRAGPERNQRMLDLFPLAEVLGFPAPTSQGTVDMLNRARWAGRDTRVVPLP